MKREENELRDAPPLSPPSTTLDQRVLSSIRNARAEQRQSNWRRTLVTPLASVASLLIGIGIGQLWPNASPELSRIESNANDPASSLPASLRPGRTTISDEKFVLINGEFPARVKEVTTIHNLDRSEKRSASQARGVSRSRFVTPEHGI